MNEQVKFSVQPPVKFTSKHSFRTGWRWGRDIGRFIEREVSRLDIERPVLHVCSGTSKLGDITVDAVHPNASIRGDMFRLPFRDESIPTILIDPPYELNIRERVKLCSEIGRIHRGGGASSGRPRGSRTRDTTRSTTSRSRASGRGFLGMLTSWCGRGAVTGGLLIDR